MPRPTRWVRTAYQGTTAYLDDFTSLAVLSPGETLLRVRLHVQLVVLDDTNAVANGPTVFGVAVEPGTADEPSTSVFGDSDSGVWIWWEGISWAAVGTWTSPETGSAQIGVGGPIDGGVRDLEARRRAGDDGATVWWLGSTNSLDASAWFGSVSASVLIAEAEGV